MAKKITMLGLLSGILILCVSIMANAAEIDKDAEKYEAGQYKVGTDITAGEYIIFADSDDAEGYFCVSSDPNQNDIIENENFSYNSIITVYEGEYLELVRSSAVPFNAVASLDISESGMFKVGIHLSAGEYKLVTTNGSESGYYCIYDDSGSRNIVINNIFDNSTYVTVEEGQYLLMTRCHIDDEYSEPANNNVPENEISELRIEIVSFKAINISEDSWTVECIVKNNAEADLRYISLSAFVCNEQGGRMNASNSRYEDIIAPGQTVSMIFSGSEHNPAYLQLYNYFYTDIHEVSDHGEFSENNAIKVDLMGNSNEEEQYQETESAVDSTAETDKSDFIYVQNDGEVHIKSYLGSSPNVVIPYEIEGGIVTTIENAAFSENEDIQSVTFPSSINSIGDNAFFNCVNLRTVEFPAERTDSLNIGSSAFAYCSISGEIIINASHLEIGYCAFSGNNDLSDFIILSDEIRFEDSVFSYCSSLESVYMKPTAAAIYSGAFDNSSEGAAFDNLSSLKAVFLPGECDFITEYTFENSPNAVIYVPEDSKIADYAAELWLPVNTLDYDEETAAILDRVSALGYDLNENKDAGNEKIESETLTQVSEETEAEQKIETELVIAGVVETEAEVTEETDTEILAGGETEALLADSLDETPLTRSDFFITIIIGENDEFDEDDKELMSFDNDALSYLDSFYPDGGAVFTYSVGSKDIGDFETPDESASKWQTYRGIGTEGSTKNDLISAYGIGLDLLYDQNSDPMVSYYTDPYVTRLFEDYAKEVLVYTYKNLYQIAFYVDDADAVLAIFYINFVAYEADEATTLSVQKTLNILGYDCGAIDGIVGSKTTEAIKKYQDDNGLFVSGIIDDELLKSLYDQGAVTLGNDLKITEDMNDEMNVTEPTKNLTEDSTEDWTEA